MELSQSVLAALRDLGPGSLYRSFGTGRGGPPRITVGVGDSVQVTIFESAAGGLFIPNDAGARPGNFIQIPAQTVDQAGYISVPYAGAVPAKGRSLPEIQADIERRLANRAIEPQAVVALTNQTSSQVTVIGQVGSPNKININPAGDRILDVISKASGIADAGYETFVSLQRGRRKETIYFLNLLSNSQENIYVAPGDVIYVFQQKRAFTAFGASGQSGQFKFEQEHLPLADAVGKAGGLLDNRADPGQVLLYRIEHRELLERMNVDLSAFPRGQRAIPTIFRANFRDPSSFFVAKSFMMQDRDTIYVTNSDSVELFKFLDLVTGISGAVANVTSDVVTTRNAERVLRR
ncbi:polysaccharide biosynthesis/export family protein [Bosea sp. (in: a-proteobacteria)]|uniref:polysaccharide biosynthesis/export family protein n=1 Tax=Bosea sp. (in: a-proteobacteria) TaxID=1871050 RepID=UPI002617BB1E|nr:polysaccharide biosynthesis/export family protein [Bosea sp. (in: a-proteobacteria)]MCO5091022.1 polysaccharide export protein [Bosea sp. (in: a-proteobacteria)]